MDTEKEHGAPTETLAALGDEHDPLVRIATALEIGTAALLEGLTILKAISQRDPSVKAELRRVEREQHKPPPRASQ